MTLMWKMRRKIRGVTMTELMIVVVVLGVLASVAYPSYRQYVARAKRVEAKAALLQIASMQERFYLQNNTYTTNLNSLGFPVNDNFLTDSESYIISVVAADGASFTALATYQRGDAEADKCRTFSIDGIGSKTSSPHDDCWTNSRN